MSSEEESDYDDVDDPFEWVPEMRGRLKRVEKLVASGEYAMAKSLVEQIICEIPMSHNDGSNEILGKAAQLAKTIGTSAAIDNGDRETVKRIKDSLATGSGPVDRVVADHHETIVAILKREQDTLALYYAFFHMTTTDLLAAENELDRAPKPTHMYESNRPADRIRMLVQETSACTKRLGSVQQLVDGLRVAEDTLDSAHAVIYPRTTADASAQTDGTEHALQEVRTELESAMRENHKLQEELKKTTGSVLHAPINEIGAVVGLDPLSPDGNLHSDARELAAYANDILKDLNETTNKLYTEVCGEYTVRVKDYKASIQKRVDTVEDMCAAIKAAQKKKEDITTKIAATKTTVASPAATLHKKQWSFGNRKKREPKPVAEPIRTLEDELRAIRIEDVNQNHRLYGFEGISKTRPLQTRRTYLSLRKNTIATG